MKNILAWFVLLLCAFSAKAQNAAPASPAVAERTVPLIFEKTYLHTDRDLYAQGDTLWFKAYLVNAQDNRSIASSGNLYVELMAPDSARVISREIIRLDNGLGNGDMELADSLPSGKYRLRAYTNWMRNFGDNFVFEKGITILNTQAVPIAPEPKTTTKNRSPKKTVTATHTATATSVTATTTPNKLPIVRFYPEGGSLVEGISAMIGIKAEDGYGSGIPVKGTVLSSAGDTVARFSCDSLGLGLLALLPVKGLSYRAVVNPVSGGLPFRHGLAFELPVALSKGLTLQVKQTDLVIHAIVSSVTDISDTGKARTVNMVIKRSGKTLLNQQLTLKGAQTAFKINTITLPEGISAITIYNDSGKPECERLVYIHHTNDLVNASIVTNKKTYQPKEKVDMEINAPANSSLSMAVVDADIVPEQAEDIVSALMLRSEIKGNIESARRYFDTTNINRSKQLDLLLLTQGWRDFLWRRLADTAIHISYAAENSIPVPGRLWDEVRNKMLANVSVSLRADGAKGVKQFIATTDSAGRFHFEGLMLYGKQNIRLSAIDGKGKDKGTLWLDTIKPLPVKTHINRPVALSNSIDSVAVAVVEKRKETMKTSKLYGVTKLKEVTIKDKKSIITRNSMMLTTFGYPDQAFNITPKDYEYENLKWYMLQNVKGAMLSRLPFGGGVPTGVEFFGIDTAGKHSVGTMMPPYIFVNGQELNMEQFGQAQSYRAQFFNMPLNKFKKIMVRHMVGSLHGVNSETGKSVDVNAIVDRYILYLTMQDNYTNDNPGWLSADVPGYYQARTFYEPAPNAKPSVADYRTTIHWEPNIKTDATGKANISFYNAVPQTNARVIVQGIAPNGSLIATVTDYAIRQ